MDGLVLKLRHACHDMHENLHVHPLLMPLSDDTITLAEYKSAIAAFYNAYGKTEQEQRSTQLPDSPVMDWLKRVGYHTITIADLAEAEYIPLNSISQQAGYLYVKQGSTLGGQVISKNLTRTLNLKAGVNNFFFHGYGPDTGTYWKEFTSALSVIEATLNAEEVIESAQKTFKTIAHYCDRQLELKHA